MTEREIRDDWIGALKEQRIRGLNISSIIKWGFYQQDLLILCDLHEADIEREMIEDLLEDCNFHTECGLLPYPCKAQAYGKNESWHIPDPGAACRMTPE